MGTAEVEARANGVYMKYLRALTPLLTTMDAEGDGRAPREVVFHDRGCAVCGNVDIVLRVGKWDLCEDHWGEVREAVLADEGLPA